MNIQRIRDLREDSDYTQEYIAKLLNVNQRTYSRYENGEHAIPLTILSFLADIQKTHISESTLIWFFYTQPSPKNEYSYLLLIAACAAIASCRTLDQANCWIIFSTLDL